MKAKWYENLRTILKNSEKDADFLRRGNFWHVRGMRGKTQVTMRIQEGLMPSNPRSTCMLDIEWEAANQTQILKAIEDLKRLVNERNLSLNEAKKLLFAPANKVDSSSENWEALRISTLKASPIEEAQLLKT